MPRPKFKEKIRKVDVILFEKQIKALDKLALENDQNRSAVIRKILAKEIKA